MPYTLKQAAEATGKTKPTILRAIQSHKISAKKDDHGEWEIDPSELHRVYSPVARNGTDATDVLPNDSGALRQENELLREMLAERDKRVVDKDAVIDDLRKRLDREGEERRQVHAQLNALLTDQRTRADREATPPPEPTPAPPSGGRGWWVVGGLAVAVIAAVTWWVLNHPRLPS